jgi:hypothetical protein
MTEVAAALRIATPSRGVVFSVVAESLCEMRSEREIFLRNLAGFTGVICSDNMSFSDGSRSSVECPE